jgi:branched-chain amino acid transport system substrate-binding protein
MASCAKQFGWSAVYGPRIAQAPVNNWKPMLEEIRALDPSVLANTHFYAGDLARFHLQFIESPLPCLLYLQYGALHRSFLDVVGDKGKGAIVGTVIGLLRDDIGKRFAARYRDRFGQTSTPEVGCQPYSSLHHYAIAAALAGGTAGPGELAQSRRIAERLKVIPYRSVTGTIAYHPEWQAAVPYPDAINDPSLGMPHLFYQIVSAETEHALIAPPPYNESDFELPPWLA